MASSAQDDGSAATGAEHVGPADLEPAAGLSSASSCIRLSLLGATFRPVYLHQLFPDERIPGWRPSAEAEMEACATAGVLDSVVLLTRVVDYFFLWSVFV